MLPRKSQETKSELSPIRIEKPDLEQFTLTPLEVRSLIPVVNIKLRSNLFFTTVYKNQNLINAKINADLWMHIFSFLQEDSIINTMLTCRYLASIYITKDVESKFFKKRFFEKLISGTDKDIQINFNQEFLAVQHDFNNLFHNPQQQPLGLLNTYLPRLFPLAEAPINLRQNFNTSEPEIYNDQPDGFVFK